jgi:hypothetical protein
MTGRDEGAVIDKLEHVAEEGGGTVAFTPEEAIVLRKVIKFVRGIEALGWIGTIAKNVLLLLGGLLVAWTQLGDWIAAHILGKGP